MDMGSHGVMWGLKLLQRLHPASSSSVFQGLCNPPLTLNVTVHIDLSGIPLEALDYEESECSLRFFPSVNHPSTTQEEHPVCQGEQQELGPSG